MLKELSLNFSLLETLEQILGYAKFRKDSVMKKRTVIIEPMDNAYHYSEITYCSLFRRKKTREISRFLVLSGCQIFKGLV